MRRMEARSIEPIAANSPQAPLRQAQDPFRASVRHPGGPPARGTADRWDRHDRGGQRPAETLSIAEHNSRFAVAPEQEGSAFVPDPGEMWREMLCVVEPRIVAADNTVAWNSKRLQLPKSRQRPHFVRALAGASFFAEA